jgi:uncharacterized repeat protein (TIGR04076 family)
MHESRMHEAAIRKAHVMVTRAFGEPCPIGFKEGDSIPVDLNAPENVVQCPGMKDALEPYIDVARDSEVSGPMEFAASCQCPYSKSEVVFYLHVSPPLHQQAASE